jgi:large subunit ribosomal protein L15
MFLSRLFPLSLQKRSFAQKILTITNVKLPKGTEKKAKRVGRGGQLKTAGRGRKGWKARHGRDRQVPAFEGGQSSIIKKVPKIGFQKRGLLVRPNLRPLYLDTLQQWIKLRRLDPSKKITIKEIAESGVAGRIKDGVYLLARVQIFDIGRRIF